jgi:hypothetical protein
VNKRPCAASTKPHWLRQSWSPKKTACSGPLPESRSSSKKEPVHMDGGTEQQEQGFGAHAADRIRSGEESHLGTWRVNQRGPEPVKARKNDPAERLLLAAMAPDSGQKRPFQGQNWLEKLEAERRPNSLLCPAHGSGPLGAAYAPTGKMLVDSMTKSKKATGEQNRMKMAQVGAFCGTEEPRPTPC